MNAIEESGKTARTFIDALKEQPLSLALVVMNCVLLGYLFYSGHQTTEARNKYLGETQKILASCIHADDLDRVTRALRGSPGSD